MTTTGNLSAITAPGLTIGGDIVTATGRTEVINPATAQPFVAVPAAGPAELQTAAQAAHGAAPSWRALPLAERQEHVLRLVAVIREHKAELAHLLTLEQGKPLAKARGEIEAGLRYCERYAAMDLGELAQVVLPPGVLQVLAGGDDLGRAITSHPLIGKISFTGSVATGRAIMASSAPTLKRLTLELGGNDAGIVLDDVDPAAFAEDLYWGGLSNCGQVCAGLKRLFVPEPLAPKLEEALAAVAATVVVGDGTDEGVDMGPIQNKPQFERVRSLLAAAEQAGAEVCFRGEAPAGPGYFHPVALVRNAADAMGLVAEEQFGPVLPILTYRDLDDARIAPCRSPAGSRRVRSGSTSIRCSHPTCPSAA